MTAHNHTLLLLLFCRAAICSLRVFRQYLTCRKTHVLHQTLALCCWSAPSENHSDKLRCFPPGQVSVCACALPETLHDASLSDTHWPPESETLRPSASWHCSPSLTGIPEKPEKGDKKAQVKSWRRAKVMAHKLKEKLPDLDDLNFLVCRGDELQCFFLRSWLLWQHHRYAALLHSASRQIQWMSHSSLEVPPFNPPISSYLAAAVLLPGTAGCILVRQRESETLTPVLTRNYNEIGDWTRKSGLREEKHKITNGEKGEVGSKWKSSWREREELGKKYRATLDCKTSPCCWGSSLETTKKPSNRHQRGKTLHLQGTAWWPWLNAPPQSSCQGKLR